MFQHWISEFDSVQMLWLMIAAVLLLLTLLPSCLILITSGFRPQRATLAAGQWFGFANVHVAAWFLLLGSLAFGPSVGMMPQDDEASPPLQEMSEMIREANEVVDRTHLFGRGGVVGDLQYAGFQHLAAQGNVEEPLFASRRTNRHVSLIAFLGLHMCVYLCAAAMVTTVASACRVAPGRILLFSLLWGTLVYAPAVHWVWGEGWLGIRGALDLGGSLFVLITTASVLGVMRFCPRDAFADDRATGHSSTNDSSQPVGRWTDLVFYAAAGLFLIGLLLLMCSVRVPATNLRAVALLNGMLGASGGFLLCPVLKLAAPGFVRPYSGLTAFCCGIACVAAGVLMYDPRTAFICGAMGAAAGLIVWAVIGRRFLHPACEFAVAMSAAAVVGLLFVGICGNSANGVAHWDRTAINSLMHGETQLLVVQSLTAAGVLIYAGISSRILGWILLRGTSPGVVQP